MKKPSVGDSYSKGWNETNPKKIEEYLTILNDLAENIEVKGRLTKANLIEVLGYLQRQNDDLVICYQNFTNDILLRSMTTLTDELGKMAAERQKRKDYK